MFLNVTVNGESQIYHRSTSVFAAYHNEKISRGAFSLLICPCVFSVDIVEWLFSMFKRSQQKYVKGNNCGKRGLKGEQLWSCLINTMLTVS